MNYTQCYIQKENKHDVAWIPSKFAIIGKTIKIKLENIWIDGWKVIKTYSVNSESHVLEHEMDYRKQRRASDI